MTGPPLDIRPLLALAAAAILSGLGPPAGAQTLLATNGPLGFLEEYRRVTLGSLDPDGGPHAGSYESPLIEFPDLPGPRLLSVGVGSQPFDDGFLPGGRRPKAATHSLAGVQLTVELVDAGGSSLLPVTRTPTLLQTARMDVPETAVGFRFFVESDDPELPFYTYAVADVTLGLGTFLDLLKPDVEEVGNLLAVQRLERAEGLFNRGSGKAERAERLARRAFEAFQRGRIAKAAELLRKARAKLDRAIATLEKTKSSLQLLAEILGALPNTGAARAGLEAAIRHLCASAQIVRAHYYLYETTFFDVPTVFINTNQGRTFYDPAAMKINLEPGDEADPSVVKHEYGHAVYAKKTGLTPPRGQHNPRRASSAELAWSEGFATFFGQVAMNSPEYVDKEIQPGRDLEMDLEANTVNGKTPAAGADVESNVQSALWDIVDGDASGVTDTDGDGLSVPFATVWACICDKPTTFAAFETCLRGKLSDAQKAALDRVKTRNQL